MSPPFLRKDQGFKMISISCCALPFSFFFLAWFPRPACIKHLTPAFSATAVFSSLLHLSPAFYMPASFEHLFTSSSHPQIPPSPLALPPQPPCPPPPVGCVGFMDFFFSCGPQAHAFLLICPCVLREKLLNHALQISGRVYSTILFKDVWIRPASPVRVTGRLFRAVPSAASSILALGAFFCPERHGSPRREIGAPNGSSPPFRTVFFPTPACVISPPSRADVEHLQDFFFRWRVRLVEAGIPPLS